MDFTMSNQHLSKRGHICGVSYICRHLQDFIGSGRYPFLIGAQRHFVYKHLIGACQKYSKAAKHTKKSQVKADKPHFLIEKRAKSPREIRKSQVLTEKKSKIFELKSFWTEKRENEGQIFARRSADFATHAEKLYKWSQNCSANSNSTNQNLDPVDYAIDQSEEEKTSNFALKSKILKKDKVCRSSLFKSD